MVGNFGPGCCCEDGCLNGYPSQLDLDSPDWILQNGGDWASAYASMEVVRVGHATFPNMTTRFVGGGAKWTAFAQMPGAGPWQSIHLSYSVSVASNWYIETQPIGTYLNGQARVMLGDITGQPFTSGGIALPGEIADNASTYFQAIYRTNIFSPDVKRINVGAFAGNAPLYSIPLVLNSPIEAVITRDTGTTSPHTLNGQPSGGALNQAGLVPTLCDLQVTIAFSFPRIAPLQTVEVKIDNWQLTVL